MDDAAASGETGAAESLAPPVRPAHDRWAWENRLVWLRIGHRPIVEEPIPRDWLDPHWSLASIPGMGAAPVVLANQLRTTLGLTRAVETGTFQGEGTQAFARTFESVATVELSEALYADTSARLRNLTNVRFILGDSREALRDLADPGNPTFYFLDGHWSEGPTAGAESQCPVLAELQALKNGHPKDCIVIDDARLFLAAPPPPYDPTDWPTLVEVIDAIRAAHPDHHITLLDQQVVAVPREAKPIVDKLGQRWAHAPVRRAARRLLGRHLSPFSPTRRALRVARNRLRASLGVR